jgi:hypothetical protein
VSASWASFLQLLQRSPPRILHTKVSQPPISTLTSRSALASVARSSPRHLPSLFPALTTNDPRERVAIQIQSAPSQTPLSTVSTIMFRFASIVPVLITLGAFILSLLVLLAGKNVDFMPDVYVLKVIPLSPFPWMGVANRRRSTPPTSPPT